MGFARVHEWQQDTFRGCTLVDASGFAVSVMSHDATGRDRFEESRVGLDHLAFRVRDRAELDEWVVHLDRLGVTHTGVMEAHMGDTIVMRDPDNIQLELFVISPKDMGQLLETDPHRKR